MAMAGANGANHPAMNVGMNGAMGMNVYAVPPQQQHQQSSLMNMGQINQMAMGSIPTSMNPTAVAGEGGASMQPAGAQMVASGADWRIQLTREHRANLIAKIYNEMVRVSADPVPGIKLWMNVSWYELTLYKESRTQEEYINKIFTRLKSLRAQHTDMNAVMAAQTLPNQGMLSRLDFSYYSTLHLNQRAGVPSATGGQAGMYLENPQYGGPAVHPGAQQSQPTKSMVMGTGGIPANSAAPANTTPQAVIKPGGGTVGVSGDMLAEYWRQHAALKAKYHDDVEKVHSAFKKYVDHMKGHDETEQKKKLRYLLSYVQLCASILNEDKTTNPPRKIEELDKVYKYIVKIVNPYLKKLRTETDKRSFTLNTSSQNLAGVNLSAQNPAASSTGIPASIESNAAAGHTSNGANGSMLVQQNQQNMSLQQKQQQYLLQQRQQQMQQQQQRMQAQARQHQMMQHQQILQQQQKAVTPPNRAHVSVPQADPRKPPNHLQNSQPTSHSQQKQQHLAQAQHAQRAQQAHTNQQQSAHSHSQQPASQQSQQSRQLSQQSQHSQPQSQAQQQDQQLQGQPHSQQPQQQQNSAPPPSRADPSSLSLDESLYGGMDSSGLLQMPSNLATSSSLSGFMNFPNDLSPTHFSSMDLLDMDGFMGHDNSNSSSGPGQNNNNSTGGNNNAHSGDGSDSDLMFMEAL